jgi:hypothetical protein
MHRTEHCNRERRAPCLSAPRNRFRRSPDQSFHARRSLSPSRGRMLVTAFPSPATAAASTASIPGSTFLACHFASLPNRCRCPFDLPLRYRSAVCSATGRLNASDPLQLPRPTRPAASPASTPLRDLHPSGSKRSAGFAANRPAFRFRPISVRSPPLVAIASYSCGSTFPVRYVFGGLLFPQTSWNLHHYAPRSLYSSMLFGTKYAIFLKTYLSCFQKVLETGVEFHVNKTRSQDSVWIASGI